MTNDFDENNNALKCDIRGGGDSYHVSYLLDEMDEREARNLTHVDNYSEDEFGDDEVQIIWIAEPDQEPGLGLIQFFDECEMLLVAHRLTPETLFQLSDMFRLIAMRVSEIRADAEARELAEQVETARMYQPLPFLEEQTND